jgi:aspartate racemase
MKISHEQNFKTIGVLGGMGAAASADFYQSLVKIAQKKYGAENDDDFPAIWIYNLPITGFDETGFVDEESVKQQLITSVKKLESAGSDFIVIPCNTVHYFYKEMSESIKIPIISILEATALAVKKAGFKKVGLLNSQSTKNYHLYENIFDKYQINSCAANRHRRTK